jgi:taurine dioxygenase
MAFKTRQLAPHFGVEVYAGDLRELADADIAELKKIWLDSQLMLFRDQVLSADEQIAFVSRFGPVGDVATATKDLDAKQRQVMIIANRKFEGKEGSLPDGEMWYHFDQAYLEVPIAAGFLYGVEVPAEGGNTLFSNAVEAYRNLSEEVKLKLDGLLAENVYDYRATTRVLAEGEEAARHEHPVVRRHPRTGKPALYVSPLMSRKVIGLPELESRELLQYLFSQIEGQASRYEHCWHRGDLLVWDNASVLHARTEFDPAEARILRRLSLAGQGVPEPYVLTHT